MATKRRATRRNPARKRRTRALSTRRRAPIRRRKRRRSASRAPTRRRTTRRRRRNPSEGISLGGIARQALPTAASFYLSRIVSQKLMTIEAPGLSLIPGKVRGPALAGALFGAGHFATKKGSLRKVRTGLLVGLGLNLIDTLVSALAPPSLKSMLGLAGADEDIYGPALADYVAMDDYVALEGAPPIENHLTLSDYVAVGDSGLDPNTEGLESELGNLEQDLGDVEDDVGDEAYEDLGDAYQDLGSVADFANRKIGGVQRHMLRAPIRRKRARAPIPRRRYSRPIPRASSSFSDPAQLYTGIFSGGFGS